MLTPEIDRVEYDRAAYEAYCSAVDNKAFNGDELPTWDDVPPHIKKAWRAAANQVVRETIDWYRAFLTEQQARMPL